MKRYVEVRPCRFMWVGGERHVTTVDEAPHTAQFWGVYAQDGDGRVMHKRDFKSEEAARDFAARLEG